MRKSLLCILIVILILSIIGCNNNDQPIDDTTQDKHLISEVIEGKWEACQIYDRSNITIHEWECEFIGTIEIKDNMYIFHPSPEIEGPVGGGKIDFLFNTPEGQVIIQYYGDVQPNDYLESYNYDDYLAFCTFKSDSMYQSTFLIGVSRNDYLVFHSFETEITTWDIRKHIDD